MIQSEQINELAAALAKAQGEMENAAKNAVNSHLKNRYADLAEIWNTVRGPLSRHGLSVVQSQALVDGAVEVDTLLMHTSGQWIRTTCAAAPAKMDPQGIGSAITYLRRYSLAAACGIAQEDDDGEGAKSNGRSQRQARPEPTRTEPLASDALLNEIAEAMHHPEITEEERGKIQTWLAEREGRITDVQARQTLDRLTGWIAERTRAAA